MSDFASVDALAQLRGRSDHHDSRFGATAQYVVDTLAAETSMRQWTLNRRSGDTFVILAANPYVGGLKAGDRVPWELTMCARMVDGRGPRVAGCVAGTAYAEYEECGIRSYLGVPLVDEANRVIGTLSGIDGRERSDLERFLPTAELLASLLSHALAGQSLLDNYARALGNATVEAETDPLTGLANRRAWERTLRAEQRRITNHSTQGGIIIVDVDGLKATNDSDGHGAGDEMLCRTADVLRQTRRAHDFVARIGGDEFGIIVGDVTVDELERLTDRLRLKLAEQDARASVGAAVTAELDLAGTVRAADAAMYTAKTLAREDGRSA